MSKTNMRKIEALEMAIKDYLDAMVYIATACPVEKVKLYLQEKSMHSGLCKYFRDRNIDCFSNEDIPQKRMLFHFVSTARLEHYFEPDDYKKEILSLLFIRYTYLRGLFKKYNLESYGLQRISVSAN